MRFALVAASFALAALVQGCATQSPAPGGVLHLDVDGDGFVTREEAQVSPRLAAHFDAADTNRDGRLDAAEAKAAREFVRQQAREDLRKRWNAADKDGDGAVSLEEAKASLPRLAERFSDYDVNGDGKITRDELHNFGLQR
jgi:hypothetical protein